MGGPDPFVIGDGLVVTHHLNPVQIGAHLHAAPDHRGMQSSHCHSGARSDRAAASS